MKKILGLSACLLAGSANAAVITFDGTAADGAGVAMGATYSEAGFTVSNDSGSNVFVDDDFSSPSLLAWDDDFLSFQSATTSQVTFTNSGSSAFNFTSAILGTFSSEAILTFEGFFSGGGSIIQSENLGLDTRALFTFSGFDNLTSLVVSAPDDGQFANMENFTFVAVPEPISLGLLGLGLAGITLSKRKKTA